VSVAFYRVAQEALNNVAKHSGATEAAVRLTFPGEDHGLRLTIEDDGVGFDPSAAGTGQLGLGIMRERGEAIGAVLTIVSEPGQGTVVRLDWSPDEAAPAPAATP
jgi:signal transduction histidine kinase